MAIAFDAAVGGYQASGSTLTVSHTVTGSNTMLLVGVRGGSDLSTITYNGVSMTAVDHAAPNGTTYLYQLVAPASGTHNVVITFSTSQTFNVVIASYTGVDQSAPEAETTAFLGFNGTFSQSVATATDNAWTVAVADADNNAGSTNGGDCTFRVADTNIGRLELVDKGPQSPTGSKTMTCTNPGGASCIWGGVMVSIAPAAGGGGGGGVNMLTLLGAGS